MSKRTQVGLCSFLGCTKPKHSKGWCHGHYTQALRGRELAPLFVPRGLRPPQREWLTELTTELARAKDAYNKVCNLHGRLRWAATVKMLQGSLAKAKEVASV